MFLRAGTATLKKSGQPPASRSATPRIDIGETLGAGARHPEQPGPSQLVDRQGHGRRFADREGRATAWGDRRYDDLAALAARQDRRTDRRLTIDILVREARRGNSPGKKQVAVQPRTERRGVG